MKSKGAAIVTGAAQGIGREIALKLADDGYDIGLSDLEAKRGLMEGLLKFVWMVANAGICPSMHSITVTTLEEQTRTLEVNGGGVFLCYKHASAKQMIHQASSIAGKRGISCTYPDLFSVRARELGKYEITVNVYVPLIGMTIEQYLAEACTITPSNLCHRGHSGDETVNEIAGTVSYLCSKEAAYITGQTVCEVSR
ncbi:hypothetical protein C8J56DRAFT_1004621 [Mycena floridula]|nr:hypothetical protein C8J56DRAFT_1004621 [Mycena floridula]